MLFEIKIFSTRLKAKKYDMAVARPFNTLEKVHVLLQFFLQSIYCTLFWFMKSLSEPKILDEIG